MFLYTVNNTNNEHVNDPRNLNNIAWINILIRLLIKYKYK